MYKAFGVIAIIMALMSFGQGSIVAALLFAAIAVILLRKPKKQPPPAAPAPPLTPDPGTNDWQTVRASASVYRPKMFAVAGVTFDNDDGSSRQQILREICDGGEDGETEAWLEWYNYRGEDAYRVMTAYGCVGNVRKTDIHDAVIAIGASNVDLNVELFEADDGRQIYRADLVV